MFPSNNTTYNLSQLPPVSGESHKAWQEHFLVLFYSEIKIEHLGLLNEVCSGEH